MKKLFTVNTVTVKDKLADALGVFNTAKLQLQEVIFSANTEIKQKDDKLVEDTQVFERAKQEFNENVDKHKEETNSLAELRTQAQNIISNIDALTGGKIQIKKDEEDGRNC